MKNSKLFQGCSDNAECESGFHCDSGRCVQNKGKNKVYGLFILGI